jgi:hypothetical protein
LLQLSLEVFRIFVHDDVAPGVTSERWRELSEHVLSDRDERAVASQVRGFGEERKDIGRFIGEIQQQRENAFLGEESEPVEEAA